MRAYGVRDAFSAFATCAGFLACSTNANSSNQDRCPSQGTYALNLTLDGPALESGGQAPLGDPTAGACSGATDGGNCQPSALAVILTLKGGSPQAGGGAAVTFDSASWAIPAGASGTCSATGDTQNVALASADAAASSPEAFCDVTAYSCTGGAVSQIGMRVAVFGPYAGAIEAAMSMNGCCWRGTASAQ